MNRDENQSSDRATFSSLTRGVSECSLPPYRWKDFDTREWIQVECFLVALTPLISDLGCFATGI